MEEWYDDLITHSAHARDCFLSDYTPFTSFLATLEGTVLDIGGGIGIVRHYLPDGIRYITVEPSLSWLSMEWTPLAEYFPCLCSEPSFVRGVGEYLPFASNSVNAILAFWSLNHVAEPQSVFREVWRVLQPGGIFLVVLEDMTPNLWDALGHLPIMRRWLSWRHVWGKRFLRFPSLLRNRRVQLQSDHIHIKESDIQRWTLGKLELVQRAWVSGYLMLEFRKVK
ncbi:MAG: class I SAM-dependent methyltransferase [Chloroflexota bacterium]|nr:class I SAM-dependent methyltransferase [Chloroflexota bacterium]